MLFLFAPVLGETHEEAEAKNQRGLASRRFQEHALGLQSALSGIDLSQFDLDKPLPEMTTNGSIASLAGFAQFGSGKTLRQVIIEGGKSSAIESVGTNRGIQGNEQHAISKQVGTLNASRSLIAQAAEQIARQNTTAQRVPDNQQAIVAVNGLLPV